MKLYLCTECGREGSASDTIEEVTTRIHRTYALCEQCCRGGNDDVGLLRRLEVYATNVHNIEIENFRQPGAKEKHIYYSKYIRDALLSWNGGEMYFQKETDEGMFYTSAHMTREELEECLEAVTANFK
jgi:hypothetical protein